MFDIIDWFFLLLWIFLIGGLIGIIWEFIRVKNKDKKVYQFTFIIISSVLLFLYLIKVIWDRF